MKQKQLCPTVFGILIAIAASSLGAQDIYDGETFNGGTITNPANVAKVVSGKTTVRFTNCTFRYAKTLLRIVNCNDVVIENCHFAHQYSDPDPFAKPVLVVSDSTNVTIRDCTFQNVDMMVTISNCEDVAVRGCESISKLRESGILVLGTPGVSGCHDIRIIDNDLEGFRNGHQGGHMIQTQALGEDGSGNKVYHTSIKINDNRLQSVAKSNYAIRDANGDKTFIDIVYPDGTVITRPARGTNGAAGDMLVMRSCKDFFCLRNEAREGGEFGITCFHSKDGTIAHNTVYRTDGSGMAIGAGNQTINIHSNFLEDVGMSYGVNDFDHITHQSGIRIYGVHLPQGSGVDIANSARGVTVRNNRFIKSNLSGSEFRYGIYMSHVSETFLDKNYQDLSNGAVFDAFEQLICYPNGLNGQGGWVGIHDPDGQYVGSHALSGQDIGCN